MNPDVVRVKFIVTELTVNTLFPVTPNQMDSYRGIKAVVALHTDNKR